MSDQYALLWSKRQNAFHIETVDRMIENGMHAFTEHRGSDYIPIKIGDKILVEGAATQLRAELIRQRQHGDPEWRRTI